MDKFEVDEGDVQLMATMVFASYHSKYELKKATKIPYATILRKIKKLKEYEMIAPLDMVTIHKKNGTPDRRRPETWDLTIKGLTYLIVNGHLEATDIEKALMRLFNFHEEFKGLRGFMTAIEYRAIFVEAVIESMEELRCRANFLYFDQGMVVGLFFTLAEKAFFKRVEKVKPRTPQDLKRFIARDNLKFHLMKWSETQLKIAQSMKKEAEEKIDQYRTILKFTHNIRS